MMSAWNLLWIIPVAYLLGFTTCALLAAARDDKEGRRD